MFFNTKMDRIMNYTNYVTWANITKNDTIARLKETGHKENRHYVSEMRHKETGWSYSHVSPV